MPSRAGSGVTQHTTCIVFSSELSISAVRREVKLCVPTSPQRTQAERQRSTRTAANIELQKSSLVMTSARSSISRASCVKERRTLRICSSAVKQALVSAVSWALMVTSASMWTSMSRTVDNGGTVDLPTRTYPVEN